MEKLMKNNLIILMSITSIAYCDISGVTYFNYSSDDGFGMKRTYFTYKNQISDELTFKFQTDVGQEPVDEDGDSQDSRWWGYLKKAQLDWKVSDNMKVSMGLIGMNMFNVQEKTWGNRFVAKSALDNAGWSSSADLGIGFSKSFGDISSSLLMTNGEGYKTSVVDDNQKLSLQVLYGEKRLDKNSGYNAGIVYSTEDWSPETDGPDEIPGGTETVTGFFGGWSNNNLVAGVEYYTKDNGTDASLMSVSMNYILANNLTMYIRQDNKDPDIDMDNDEEDTTMAGFVWTPTKGLSICPNINKMKIGDETFKVNFEFKF